jgi:16S rRNA (guanine1516-N2)-methyltransferase
MNQASIAVTSLTVEQANEARLLAEQLKLAYIQEPKNQTAQRYDYLLIYTPDYLGLHRTSNNKINPFYIDFLSTTLRYRQSKAGLRNERLARAIGSRPSEHPTIVDATAGLGRDSFILASLGFQITLLERSPILCALFEDALKRARLDVKTAPIIERMQLIQADAITWLTHRAAADISERPQIVYLDPMFPERKKSASVKKEMVILQDLLGSDSDSADLFQAAISCATKRVVVKRPRLAANVGERTPSFTLAGSSNRFDIYLTIT